MKLLDSFNQWFSPRENFEDLPQGPLGMSGDIIGCHKGEGDSRGCWHRADRGQEAAKYTGVLRTSSHNKEFSSPNVTTEFEKTCLQVCTCAKLIKNIST